MVNRDYLVPKRKEYGQKFKVLSKNDEVVFQVRQDSMQLLTVINSYLYEVVFGQKRYVFKSDFCHIIFEQDLEILATVHQVDIKSCNGYLL